MKHRAHKPRHHGDVVPKPHNGSIEYVTPESETIRAYAGSVCEAMALRTNDQIYTRPHVARGLAQFIELALRAQAKYLNDRGLVDKPEK